MTDTVNLGLPCIEGSQAQKHVTHNDALRILDTLVQLAVLDRDLTAPPGAPAEGQRWIVKATATGAWAGHNNAIAAWQDGGWQFSTPQVGWVAFVVDEGTLVAWNGTAWGDFFATVTSLQNLARLGLGTTADATNPFSAKLNNTLWAAKTVAEGGDGNLRYKLSKESAAKTLSLLFQDNYSGRAEIGLTGDDNFHVKVSADGAAWSDGIVIDRTTGAVSFPNTTIAGGRELLTANRTYYVRADGADSNNGLANTSGGAFLTIQKAIDVAASLDLGIADVTIQLGNGTYTGAVTLKSLVGAGQCIILGDTTTPANVLASTTAAHCFFGANFRGKYSIRGVKMQTTTSGRAVWISGAGAYVGVQAVDFGACAMDHMLAQAGARINIEGNYTISGAALRHYFSSGAGAYIDGSGKTVTLTGTPAFSTGFAIAEELAETRISGFTFSGAATGPRYSVALNALVSSNGGGANYFPGNSAGATATGGQYS